MVDPYAEALEFMNATLAAGHINDEQAAVGPSHALDARSFVEIRSWIGGGMHAAGPTAAERLARMVEREPERREEVKARLRQECWIRTETGRGGETTLYRFLHHGLLSLCDLMLELGACGVTCRSLRAAACRSLMPSLKKTMLASYSQTHTRFRTPPHSQART